MKRFDRLPLVSDGVYKKRTRLGELIKQEQETGRLALQGRPQKGDTNVTFLKDYGLTRKASQAR
jgi:hypothetical protein